MENPFTLWAWLQKGLMSQSQLTNIVKSAVKLYIFYFKNFAHINYLFYDIFKSWKKMVINLLQFYEEKRTPSQE
jgi:hypothetical protein